MRQIIVYAGIVPLILSALVACVVGPDRAPSIRDDDPFAKRVYGCAAGFGDEVAGKLVIEYEEAKKNGKAGIEAARKTAAAVLTLLPEADRLEGYKIYTTCISKNIEKPIVSEKDTIEMAVAACTGGFEVTSEYETNALNLKSEIDLALLSNSNIIENQSSYVLTQSLGGIENIDSETYKLYIECVQSYYKLIKPGNG
jgi:hypothetical protein